MEFFNALRNRRRASQQELRNFFETAESILKNGDPMRLERPDRRDLLLFQSPQEYVLATFVPPGTDIASHEINNISLGGEKVTGSPEGSLVFFRNTRGKVIPLEKKPSVGEIKGLKELLQEE